MITLSATGLILYSINLSYCKFHYHLFCIIQEHTVYFPLCFQPLLEAALGLKAFVWILDRTESAMLRFRVCRSIWANKASVGETQPFDLVRFRLLSFCCVSSRFLPFVQSTWGVRCVVTNCGASVCSVCWKDFCPGEGSWQQNTLHCYPIYTFKFHMNHMKMSQHLTIGHVLCILSLSFSSVLCRLAFSCCRTSMRRQFACICNSISKITSPVP